MTQNQAKAADLLKMLRTSGVDTMAGELEEIIAEAWMEGEQFGEGQDMGYRTVVNPYKELGL